MRLVTFGPVDDNVRQQIQQCIDVEPETARAVLCADNHLGYAMPIGGVIAYERHVSPSAVGVDIGCGNKAVRTDARLRDLNLEAVMDDVWARVSFGMGRKNPQPVDHPVMAQIEHSPLAVQRGLVGLAASQLGTVGGGNHYVDLFADEDGFVWIGVHFGSRGFGFKTNKWVLGELGARDDMMAPPAVIPTGTALADDYIVGMELAGAYAMAGRDVVIDTVLGILGAAATFEVHNWHNYMWREEHFGRQYYVHRKGATPARPGQAGFVGSTMGDQSVILDGVDSPDSAEALYSTVHGAGRAHSRKWATHGLSEWRCEVCGWKVDPREVPKDQCCPICPPQKPKKQLRKVQMTDPINYRDVQDVMKRRGIELRGGAADESPACYKVLGDVLGYHWRTIAIQHWLRPVGVAMADGRTFDAFKD